MHMPTGIDTSYAAGGDQFSLHEQPHEPEFDRLVFVLIDALRNDFMIGKDSGFKFVSSHIEQGTAYPFTAKATAPTVTLPRIKALTTGTIPSFLDAILNIAESDTTSSLENHDNWVYQFKQQNKTIHFFGDDTWMRLFPAMFDKTDGTTSFFVSDTTEVDLNVTRHIKTDLVEPDWDAVIFHYLGLDHIGHLGGPQSPLMKPKQMEMDQAIESIYTIVAEQDARRMQEQSNAKGTLIVVCGDHGMNEKGNHGGSSIGETSAGLVFMSPQFESRPTKKLQQQPLSALLANRQYVLGFPVIDQIDIVPTLATLFSFPIPKNNLGKVILDLYVSKQDFTSILNSLLLNASQLGQLLSKIAPEIAGYLEAPSSHANDATLEFGQSYARAISLHREYLISKDGTAAKQAIELYYHFIEAAQSQLSNTASDYNIRFMVAGVVLISCSTVGLICLWLLFKQQSHAIDIWSFSQYFSVLALILYALSMFASSFVEEEHYTWYYLVQTLTVLSAVSSFRIPVVTVGQMLHTIVICFAQMLLVRTAIAWNHNQLSDLILSYSGIQWHLMGLTLFTTVIFGIKTLYKLSSQSSIIDVNSTAQIIQNLVRAAMLIIAILVSLLVFVYKLKAAATDTIDEVPEMYAGLLNWELVQPLDQVALGKLIYNYGGAGLFVLGGLFYVTKRAHLLDLVQDDDARRDDDDDQEELQMQALQQAHKRNAILIDTKRTLVLQMLLFLITPLLILQSRPENAVLFVLFHVQLELLTRFHAYLQDKCKLSVPTWLIGVLIASLSHASFFLTGHSNSIASVDLSNAYIGVEEYDTILIGLLTFCSNWSGSIWWSIAGWTLVSSHENKWFSYMLTHAILFSVAMTALSISVTVLREHLFIWTVFSPKYLYQIVWNVLFHWILQVCIGSIITQVVFCV
ncbi:sulfatase [Mucor ambiguus]|uniref:GPI ethanolamine phosphate transferase 2 n=1 Tax=Mucor ambiguus TaxID=91626 RepID=A0A0C9MI62_9FUNG|nr:sulfatase [Mucor ambiguus]